MRKYAVVIGVGATLALVGVGAVVASADGKSDLAEVRRATAAYHDVAAAEDAGYEAFLECFEDAAGGQGQHYVELDALDDVVDASSPEALVYEVKGDELRLVAVEYIVPNSPEVAADPPALFGESFHLNTTLDVWVLHAWIWRANPAGMFADWNTKVGPCPT